LPALVNYYKSAATLGIDTSFILFLICKASTYFWLLRFSIKEKPC
jgi:hypothetical protein